MVTDAKKRFVLIIMLALASAMAQTPTADKPTKKKPGGGLATAPRQGSKADTRQQVKMPDPVPIPDMSPEELPARAPRVSYRDGELFVEASNAMLGEVLNAISKELGALVEKPPAADGERVAVHLSGTPRSVIRALLNDSKFNYIILGPPDDPAGIQKLVLMTRAESDTRPSASAAVRSALRRGTAGLQTASPQSEPGPTPEFPTADGDAANSATATHTSAAQLNPDEVLQENMAHAASQLTAATGALNSAKASNQKTSSDAPTETQSPSLAPEDATQSSPDSAAAQPLGDKTPKQLLQDLYETRRQLQQQQNQAQKPQ